MVNDLHGKTGSQVASLI